MFVDPTLGNVTIFAGNFAPMSYMLCQGQLLSINSYQALFAIIGTIYGGDGMSTFALPNMNNRMVVGVGQSPGTSNYVEGQVGGNTTITLTQSNVPSHTHTFTSFTSTFPISTAAANSTTPVGNVPAVVSGDPLYFTTADGVMGSSVYNSTTVPAGASSPVTITSPYLAMYYIIAVEGIFPSRN